MSKLPSMANTKQRLTVMGELAFTEQQDGPGQRARLRYAIEGLIEAMGSYRNCITCGWFDGKTETCQQEKHRGLKPPAKIIAYGCEDHSDLIPF